MAKIFLDANYFIDLVEQRKKISFNKFKSHSLYLSPLTIHIYIYLYKIKIPDKNLEKLISLFNIVPIEEKIFNLSLQGPFADFKDNLQLHSSSFSECDIYLTNDKKILKLKFFGKTRIINSLEEI